MTAEQITEDTQQTQNTAKRSNMTLWVMIVLFGLPYVAAMYFYFFADRNSLGDPSNYGTLITPVRLVSDQPLKTLDDTDFKFAEMKGSWIFISIGNSLCDQICQDNLYKMRQIRKAVGQERSRINRVFLLTDTSDIESFKQLLPGYEGMNVIKPSGNSYQELLSSFSVSGESTENGIYIVDPMGNYMMAYPSGADAEKILKDVRRLLKVSKIG